MARTASRRTSSSSPTRSSSRRWTSWSSRLPSKACSSPPPATWSASSPSPAWVPPRKWRAEMGIFEKLSRVLRSNINDLISRAENPEKMLNQIILDMRDQLAKAKREVAAAIADERKLKSQAEAEVKQARDWEDSARLDGEENRNDIGTSARA